MKVLLLCLLIGLAAAAVVPTPAVPTPAVPTPAAPTNAAPTNVAPTTNKPVVTAGSVPLDSTTTAMIVVAGVFSLLFAYFQFTLVSKIKLGEGVTMQTQLLTNESNSTLIEIYEAIRTGARSFLKAEYKICCIFIVLFGGVIFVLTSYVNNTWDFKAGGLTALSFVVGAVTSMVSGYIGMMVAVFSNARTTVSAMTHHPWTDSFNTAFRAGSVMGFCLCGMALLSMYVLCVAYNAAFDNTKQLFECVAGFGLGGSSIAMFGRVGGGIYTKAADVGADLAGKVVANIPEDDPRNPATIADNVGDNVGDVAGMGSDLFGSFAEASCAAFVVISTSLSTSGGLNAPVTNPIMEWKTLMYPAMISALGIFVCAVTSFVATNISPVRRDVDVEKVLKMQIFVSTILITAFLYFITDYCLPAHYFVFKASGAAVPLHGDVWKACGCVWAGLWAGCMIGFITEYYTSHSYKPTREVAQSCETGAATNIIYGLALGYKSAVIPVTLISVVVLLSFSLLDMFGVSLAALGMLSNLATCLSIDVYGPVCDNAGGIAEMAELPAEVRAITDELDAAGNTTAAIGKGFAIGSACLVGLALFGAFIKRSSATRQLDSSLLDPLVFSFLLLGAMIPYWFTALTMKSVGVAAMAMVKEVAHQFKTKKGLLEGTPGHEPPDHERCIAISTDASLREMILPGILVMGAPLATGILFGSKAVVGLLSGAIASAVQMAISQSNTGGAWDNAKKYVEKGCVFIADADGVMVKQGKGSEIHKAAVVGDTVGDPLKDTSGPALNIVMKLMAILSLVFADFFNSIGEGRGLIGQHISSE
jgi:H(+)-translocating pyrophosphatase